MEENTGSLLRKLCLFCVFSSALSHRLLVCVCACVCVGVEEGVRVYLFVCVFVSFIYEFMLQRVIVRAPHIMYTSVCVCACVSECVCVCACRKSLQVSLRKVGAGRAAAKQERAGSRPIRDSGQL